MSAILKNKRLALLAALLMLCLGCAAMACAESATPTDVKPVKVKYESLTFMSSDETIDLKNVVVKDYKAFCAFLDKMPNLKQVDMYQTRIYRKDMDMLAKRYPNIRWGWTMVLRNKDHQHLIRTDVTAWSTLHNNKSKTHSSEDFSILKYCWQVKALDVGHNNVTDLSFLSGLTELRVLILACNHVSDISPLANLTKLEYAELFKNNITDLTPLTGLTNLLDLNICFNRVKDWDPLLGLTGLKRLWVYNSNNYSSSDPIKPAVVAKLKSALPKTEVDSKHYSTAGTWRKTPHYEIIFKMFKSSTYIPFEDSYQ